MHIRCPHCQNAIEVVQDTELQDLVCPSCGSSFNLLPDETVSRQSVANRTLGRFELVERIGIGAFGEVWTAHDSELDRTVAVKIPRKGQLTVEETEAFLREARSAAQLHHPNIVAIHEVGKDDDVLYIVSDFVKGITLADWLTAKRPTPKEAAELCAKIADAVQHAHDNGVIHRDLKPSNIMLDDDGQPHIMDFGLAKREAGEITMTVDGRVLGTPAYMSPEQAIGAAHDADGRSDVYSLGVILFELLTGELPFRGNPRMLVHQVINEEPPSPRLFHSGMPRDVETVCSKCLEKDPGKRYRSATNLASDLRRFLTGAPVHARPVSRMERLWRRCRKNRLVTALVAGIAATLLLGTVASLWFAHVARQEAAVARKAQNAAQQSEKKARRRQYVSEMYAAHRAMEDSDVTLVQQLLDSYIPEADDQDLRDFAWYYLWRTSRISCTSGERYIPVEGLRSAQVSPDGRRLAVATFRGAYVTLWDLQTGRFIDEFGHRDDSRWFHNEVAFSHDSKILAYPSGDYSEVILRNLEQHTETRVPVSEPGGNSLEVLFSPIGDVLATTLGDSHTLRLWNWKSRQIVKDLDGHEAQVWALAFSPQGDTLASGDEDGKILLWGLAETPSTMFLSGHTDRINALAFAPDGKRLASASSDRTVRIWDTASGELLWSFPPFPDEARGVAFSPDGALLAGAGRDHVIRLWDATDYDRFGIVRDYLGNFALSFLHDGRLAFSGERGFTICSIRPPPQDQVLVVKKRHVSHVALTNVGKDQLALCALGWGMNRVRVWQVENDRLVELPSVEPGFVPGCIAANHSGSLVVGEYRGQRVAIHDLSQSRPKQDLFLKEPVGAEKAVFSRNGRWLAIGCADGRIATWRLGSDGRFDNSDSLEIKAHDEAVTCLSYAPSGLWLASGSRDKHIKVWATADGTLEHDFGPQQGWLFSVAFSPKRDRLAASFFSPDVVVWRWPSRERDYAFRAHFMAGSYLAFLQNGRSLVSAGTDRVAKIWDLETKRESCVLKGESSIFTSLAVSPDEKTIAAGARDGTVHIYRAATEEQVRKNQDSN